MKECRVCKTVSDDSVVFCCVCGAKLPDPIIPPLESPPKENNNNPQFDNILNELKEIKSLLEPKKYEYMAVDKWSFRDKINTAHKDEISDENSVQADVQNNQIYLKYAVQYLNALGNEGWELIINDDTFQDCYLLRRKLPKIKAEFI